MRALLWVAVVLGGCVAPNPDFVPAWAVGLLGDAGAEAVDFAGAVDLLPLVRLGETDMIVPCGGPDEPCCAGDVCLDMVNPASERLRCVHPYFTATCEGTTDDCHGCAYRR